MTLKIKQIIIAVLGVTFLISLIFVQWMEVNRQRQKEEFMIADSAIPKSSKGCVDCHKAETRGIVDHWMSSTHAAKHVGCVECHQAEKGDADAWNHKGTLIATIVTPRDCARCHKKEAEEFAHSHHAKGGEILNSLDNILAEKVEGSKIPFNPHNRDPGTIIGHGKVNGMASVNVGCKQCHGSTIALVSTSGKLITATELAPHKETGQPTNKELLKTIKRDDNGRPVLDHNSWPNTGIGRINLDGSRGSCSACHSRHDFSPRRARQPENCAKCHLGPDHPQKEIFEESKHGVAYRDLKDRMNLNAHKWVLGEDYSQAPTCATCHMSGHSKNGGKVTHDPGKRISWTNRPYISRLMDTDKNGKVVTETDPNKRSDLIHETWQEKRTQMKLVCSHCHTENYVNGFYKQYDDFIINYNEKFGKPGKAIMNALKENELLTKQPFDEEIEWTWFYLWHHEGRRARHGASMMAPDYAHWHGMFEVAERFYMKLIPQAREIAERAAEENPAAAEAVFQAIQDILDRPEHQWYEKEKVRPGKADKKAIPKNMNAPIRE